MIWAWDAGVSVCEMGQYNKKGAWCWIGWVDDVNGVTGVLQEKDTFRVCDMGI